MKLLELLQSVKDQTLEKEQLEEYRDSLCSMYSDLQIEVADLEKKEAIYYVSNKTPEKSAVSVKYDWKVTPEGQRLILLNRYLKGTSRVIDSLKMRIYAKLT